MKGRDMILGRIREALRRPAPAPHHHRHGTEDAGSPRDWLPPVGESFQERVDLFAGNADSLKATFEQHSSLESAAGRIVEVAAVERWRRVASHSDPLTEQLVAPLAAAGIGTLWIDGGYEPPALEECDAGITTCEALIAQTGSVLVSSAGSGGRALSVLPPHHVVIARRSQMLPDLHCAFTAIRQKFGESFPSMLSFITGPSRTGDIERILVLGAHGPKKLTILMVP